MTSARADRASTGPAGLGSRVRRGLGWGLGTQVGVRVLTMASTVALLRLVTPADYGVYVLALSIVSLVMAVNDVGQSIAVTRWPEEDVVVAARAATTVAWAASASAFAVLALGAAPLARLGGVPGAAGPLRLLAVLVLVDGVTAVPRGLLLRTFRSRAVALIDLGTTVVNVGVTLGVAALRPGPWAPALGTVVTAVVAGVAVLRTAPWIPRPGGDVAVVRSTLRFGIPLVGALVIELLLLNADYVVVARELGPAALGLYAVAFNVASWPVALFSVAIRRVSIPAFAELAAGDAAVAPALVGAIRVLAVVVLPLSVGLGVLAEPVLRILYGARFAPVAGALAALVVLGAARVATGLVVDALLARGRSRATVHLQGLWLLAALPALVTGAHLAGLGGVARAHAAVGLLVALPLHALAARGLGVAPRALVAAVARPLGAAVVAAVVGVAATRSVDGPWARLGAGGGAVAVTYLAVLVPRAGARRLAGLVRGRGRGRGDGRPWRACR